MRKLLLLTLALALVPAFSPAEASSLTLAQRVAKVEAKLKCVVKTPVSEFANFANYGDPITGENASHAYLGGAGEAPDQLTDRSRTFPEQPQNRPPVRIGQGRPRRLVHDGEHASTGICPSRHRSDLACAACSPVRRPDT